MTHASRLNNENSILYICQCVTFIWLRPLKAASSANGSNWNPGNKIAPNSLVILLRQPGQVLRQAGLVCWPWYSKRDSGPVEVTRLRCTRPPRYYGWVAQARRPRKRPITFFWREVLATMTPFTNKYIIKFERIHFKYIPEIHPQVLYKYFCLFLFISGSRSCIEVKYHKTSVLVKLSNRRRFLMKQQTRSCHLTDEYTN